MQRIKPHITPVFEGGAFSTQVCPHGIWLRIHDFEQSPIWREARPFLGHTRTLPEQEGQLDAHVHEWISREVNILAQSLLLYRPVQQELTWRSTETHTVRRIGFPLTHGRYLTSTSAQGQTLRCGTIIDCARAQSQGFLGLSDDQWWLHLYDVFSCHAYAEHVASSSTSPGIPRAWTASVFACSSAT